MSRGACAAALTKTFSMLAVLALSAVTASAALATPAAVLDAPHELIDAQVVDGGAASVERIDINRASSEALVQLPGIGPKKAAAIIAFRNHAPFTSVRQLLDVKGIGPHTLQRLRPLVYVDSIAAHDDIAAHHSYGRIAHSQQ